MAGRNWDMPVLRTVQGQSEIEHLHAIFVALRDYHNTRQTIDFTLPWGALDGCMFGITDLRALLDHAELSGKKGLSRLEVLQRVDSLPRSANPVETVAQFVRESTSAYTEFMCHDPTTSTDRGRWGLTVMSDVEAKLVNNTIVLDHHLQDPVYKMEHDRRFVTILMSLQKCTMCLIEHHFQIGDSRSGLEETLQVAKEVDDVKGAIEGYLENIFHAYQSRPIPPSLTCLDEPPSLIISELHEMVDKELKQRGEHLPAEHALQTIAQALPRLSVDSNELRVWVPLMRDNGLGHIGDKLWNAVIGSSFEQSAQSTPMTTSASNHARSPRMEHPIPLWKHYANPNWFPRYDVAMQEALKAYRSTFDDGPQGYEGDDEMDIDE